MSTKKDSTCLEKAYPDEQIFVLLARDISSPAVICEWIKQNIATQPREKLIAALDCAIAMRDQYIDINDRKAGIIRCIHKHCIVISKTNKPFCGNDTCPGKT